MGPQICKKNVLNIIFYLISCHMHCLNTSTGLLFYVPCIMSSLCGVSSPYIIWNICKPGSPDGHYELYVDNSNLFRFSPPFYNVSFVKCIPLSCPIQFSQLLPFSHQNKINDFAHLLRIFSGLPVVECNTIPFPHCY